MAKLVTLIVIILFSTCVWASPATNLQLAYSLGTQTLLITANHPQDRDRHFIQRVAVTKNSQEKKNFYFSHQTRADKFIADIPFPAVEGDHLDVELYSSEGGLTTGGIDVAPEVPKETYEKTIPLGK